MNGKLQPGDEMFDDVEGPAMRGKVAADDDVEGHAFKIRGVNADESDEVEGHGIRPRGLVADEDDVDGHVLRGRG